ncbi:MAG: transporter substrate-binding domain-containing protein [Desulforhopalus sp.]|nr:transporter substrate-binding domain-containing protein [Desulforhopalus sp.]
MKKLTALFAVLVMSLAFISSAAALDTLTAVQKRGVLRVGTASGYMPFEMKDTKGEIIGFDMDIAKSMAKAMDVKLKVVNIEFDGLIAGLLTDKFDIIIAGMTLTSKRNLRFNFPDPYIWIGQSALINKKNADTIKSYLDLNDSKYTVASTIGTTGEFTARKLLKNAKYVAYETQQEGVMEVMNGKVDAFCYDMPYNAVAIQKMGGDKLVHLDKQVTKEPVSFAIRRDDPNFLNWCNNFVLVIKNDGVYDKIYKKWFESNDWLKELK